MALIHQVCMLVCHKVPSLDTSEIYINDITNLACVPALIYTRLTLFADDISFTGIICTCAHSDTPSLQNDISKIYNWSQSMILQI